MAKPLHVTRAPKRKRADGSEHAEVESKRILRSVAAGTVPSRQRQQPSRPQAQSQASRAPPSKTALERNQVAIFNEVAASPVPLLEFTSLHRPPSPRASTEHRIKAWLADDQANRGRESKRTGRDMSSSQPRSRRSRKSGSDNSQPSSATTVDSFISIYDPQVMRVLIENGVNDSDRSGPPENLLEIQARMAQPRASLSPSRYDANANFQQHRLAHYRSFNETDIAVAFSSRFPCPSSTHATGRNTSFSAMADLTTPPLPKPKPDAFSGVDFERIPQSLRNDIGPYILSTQNTDPALVNSFTEYKGPQGRESNLLNRVVHNGATGARTIYKTRSYQRDGPPDGNARSFVTTYHAGTARFYATHIQASTSPSTNLTYHTYQVGGEDTLASPESLRRSIASYRNLQDLAAEERELALQQAASRSSSIASRSKAMPRHNSTSKTRRSRHGAAQHASSKHRRTRRAVDGAEADSHDEAESDR